MTVWFTLDDDGRITATLPPLLGTVLGMVARDMRGVVEAGARGVAGNEALERLFPRAYSDPTEDDAEREWQAVVHEDLVRAKVDHLERLAASLERAAQTPESVIVTLDGADVDAWLAALNDARLVLGTQLQVTPDTDLRGLAADDPRQPAADVYLILGELQQALVTTILGWDPERGS